MPGYDARHLRCGRQVPTDPTYGLARGASVAEARAAIGQEVEGVITAAAVRTLAHRLGVEMPISEQVYQVLYKGVPPLAATAALLEREPKAEFG
jgi:glycerol-3-phosphate dehydrogenase (NAD(P)+)